MAQAKHTPGPWELVFCTACGFEVKSAEGRTISAHNFPDATDYANGVLTAAAPELLAELEDLINQIDRRGYHNDFSKQCAIIAKAKGKDNVAGAA